MLPAIRTLPLIGEDIDLTSYFLKSEFPFERPEVHGTITKGTGIAAAAQTANVAAVQAAVTASATSGRPVLLPGGTVLFNDEITSEVPVTILGRGPSVTKLLQTTAGKHLFRLGPLAAIVHQYGYTVGGFTAASAAGSLDALVFRYIKDLSLDNIIISAAGRFGIQLNYCQDVHARAVHCTGYADVIPGQNQTGSSNGVFGNGLTTGAGWYITGNTTTVSLFGCDCNISTGGIFAEGDGLALTWIGTAEGLVLNALRSNSASAAAYDLNLYLDTHYERFQIAATANNGAGLIRVTTAAAPGVPDGALVRITGHNASTNGTWIVNKINNTTFDLESAGTWTPSSGGFVAGAASAFVANAGAIGRLEFSGGGIDLTNAYYGRIYTRNTDFNGIRLDNCYNFELKGSYNRVRIENNCRRIAIRDAAVATGDSAGYLYDFAPDTSIINVRSGQDNVFYGRPESRALASIHPNRQLERWDGTSVPCGWTAYSGATVTRESGAGNVYSGTYSAKVIANFPGGMRFSLEPIASHVGKFVTVTGRYKSTTDSYVGFFIDGAVNKYVVVPSSGGVFARFEATLEVPIGSVAAAIILAPDGGNTVYYDDVDILSEGLDLVSPQTFTDLATSPSISLGSAFCPIWKFANSAPTNVVNFQSGYGGQIYTVMLDANTTLKHGASIKLRGGTDKTGANMILQLMYDSESQIWRQVGYESLNA